MPRIVADYVESLVFLYPTAEAACANEDAGGSGFLLGVEYKEQPARAHVYVVTNGHVSDMTSPSRVVRMQSRDGEILDLSGKNWVEAEEDDVAVCSLDRSALFSDVAMVRATDVLREGDLEDDTATYRSDHPRYGDEVFMASRLANEKLKDGSVPAVRFGTLASSRPAAVEHPRGFYQDSFLVEMRSVSGHSGSPVFLHYNDATLHMRQGLKIGPVPADIRLLGIDWGHLEERFGTSPVGSSAWNAGISCIVPAWKITELLEDEELIKERRRVERLNTPV